jgi:hypothetical protein
MVPGPPLDAGATELIRRELGKVSSAGSACGWMTAARPMRTW